ncbi:MAG: HNH endonuclease [Sulfuritalea sp.]|jgi:hypothetical protein|nr:HNH endonuclease [Sulfuritalea sp.]
MAKERIPIHPETAAAVLFASDHTCCVCRDRGRAVQIHHIDENPSNNTDENLSVLCLLCHDNTQIKGGFGRKLDSKVVIQYRDDWLQRVRSRRDKADELAALRMAGSSLVVPSTEDEAEALMIPADEALVAYVKSLPTVLGKGYENAQPRWDTGITAEMVQGSYDLIDIVIQMLVHLASWFPANHFGGKPAAEYFSQFVSTRFIWHRALAEAYGVGTGGTIVGPITASAVLSDVEGAVDEMVTALLWGREGFSLKAWRTEWRRGK